MNVAYVNPFIVATLNVFRSMVHVPIMLGRPYLKDRDDRLYKLYKLSATIGLSGAASGVVILSLPEPVALALASGLAGAPVTSLDTDCHDAVAEIVNMIAGGAKKDLPGGQVTLGVPTLLYTGDVVYPDNCPVMAIPFDTSVGRFVIETALHEQSG